MVLRSPIAAFLPAVSLAISLAFVPMFEVLVVIFAVFVPILVVLV